MIINFLFIPSHFSLLSGTIGFCHFSPFLLCLWQMTRLWFLFLYFSLLGLKLLEHFFNLKYKHVVRKSTEDNIFDDVNENWNIQKILVFWLEKVLKQCESLLMMTFLNGRRASRCWRQKKVSTCLCMSVCLFVFASFFSINTMLPLLKTFQNSF